MGVFSMKLPENVKISGANPDVTRSEIERLLDDLASCGLQVEISDQVHGDDYECCATITGRPYARGVNEELLRLLQPLAIGNIPDLIQLRERTRFDYTLNVWRPRIAALGYTILYDDRASAHIELSSYDGSAVRFNRSSASALAMQDYIERFELRQDLIDHNAEFMQAGITVSVLDQKFEFVLQENDPAIQRRMTKENVDKLIALARAYNTL